MLRGMRSQRRVAIATLGGGAAASDAVWKDLYGSLVIWVGTFMAG